MRVVRFILSLALAGAVVVGIGLIAARPASAAAATCSGSSCLTISIPEDPVRRDQGQVQIVVLFDLTGAPVADATMTVHLTPGLHLDPKSVYVNPNPVPPAQVTVHGNDVTFPVGAFNRNNAPDAGFRVDVVTGATADQTVDTDVTFRGSDGGPAATAASNDYVVHPGPDLAVNAVAVDRPDGLGGPAIPHGYTSDAWFPTNNLGLTTVPAGASVRVRVSAGFHLVPGGVRYAVSNGNEQVPDGSGGITLRCIGGPRDETCTGVPAVPPGDSQVLAVRVAVPDATPVGAAGAVTVTATAPGDSDITDKTATVPLRCGAVARLTYAMTVDHPTLAVGTSTRVTITVHNSGPQAAAGWVAYVDGDYFDPGAIRLHAVETSGLDADQTHPTLVYFHVATLAPGQTWTRHVTLSARHVDVQLLRLGNNDPNPRTFNANCPTLICAAGPKVRVRVVTSIAATTPPSTTVASTTASTTTAPSTPTGTTAGTAGGPTLAATGSDDGPLATAGLGLLVTGLALMLAGRRRPTQTTGHR